MIVNIAGTSGSGKSHLVRSFLNWAREKHGRHAVTNMAEGYKVVWGKGEERRWVYVVGLYARPTGGCDALPPPAERAFDIVDSYHSQGWDVLYEGLFVMNQTRGPQMAEKWGNDFCVIQLTTPLSLCFDSIDERRAKRGAAALTKRANTRQNFKRAQNYCAKIVEAGGKVIPTEREAGLDALLKVLNG